MRLSKIDQRRYSQILAIMFPAATIGFWKIRATPTLCMPQPFQTSLRSRPTSLAPLCFFLTCCQSPPCFPALPNTASSHPIIIIHFLKSQKTMTSLSDLVIPPLPPSLLNAAFFDLFSIPIIPDLGH